MTHARTQLSVPSVVIRQETVEGRDLKAVLLLSFERLLGRKPGAIPMVHHHWRRTVLTFFLVFLGFDFEPTRFPVVEIQKVLFNLERLTKNTSAVTVLAIGDSNDASRGRLLFFKPD
jgi:hypothetical protein